MSKYRVTEFCVVCHERYDFGYDCRYSYSEFGMNLQPTEMQASIGVAQLKKLPEFIKKRKYNHSFLKNQLGSLNKYFYVQHFQDYSDVSPFAFLMTVKGSTPFTRNEIVQHLEKNGIETRFLFAGNILKQKCFKSLQEEIDYRVIGDLYNTNFIMDNSFFIGCYPGLTPENLDYMVNKVKEFIDEKTNKK